MYKRKFIIRTRKYALGLMKKSHQDGYQEMDSYSQSVCLSVSLPNYLLVFLLYSGSALFWCVGFGMHIKKVDHTTVTVLVINFSSKFKCY